MVKVKAYDLRKKDNDALKKQLEELRQELAQLRVAKVAGGAPSKLAKIKIVRKAIARVLTVIGEKRIAAAREQFKDTKLKPLELRLKQIRKMRRALSKEQLQRLPLKLKKRKENFPQRKFTLSA